MRISDWSSDVCSSDLDNYGQTELSMVPCNHHGLTHPVHMGAAGFASPGHRIVVLDEDHAELGVGQPGILAVDRRQSPMCWFAGYEGGPTKAFVGDYYLSGDTVEFNPDGSISFVGRSEEHTSELQSLIRISYAFF